MAQRHPGHIARCAVAAVPQRRLSGGGSCRRSWSPAWRAELLFRPACSETLLRRSRRGPEVEQVLASSPPPVYRRRHFIHTPRSLAMVMHGGRALMFAREHNVDFREVLDFSASINPLGPSPKAIAAIRDSADLIRVYPEEDPVRLILCLSDRFNIPKERLLAGNGATELLYFWLRAIRPSTATLIIPTFTEYRRALESIGAGVRTLQLDADDHSSALRCSVNVGMINVAVLGRIARNQK